MNANPRKGFTFVELLVAMVFFGVLSAIAIPRYRDYKERAYLTTLRTDLGELRIAQEAYWAENAHYATDVSLLDFKPTSEVTLTIAATDPDAGYQGRALHDLLPATQCAVYVGRDIIPGTPSGEIVCGPAQTPGAGPKP